MKVEYLKRQPTSRRTSSTISKRELAMKTCAISSRSAGAPDANSNNNKRLTVDTLLDCDTS